MRIESIIWLPNIVNKLDWKHNVATEEVEEIFHYLIIFFIYKPSHKALIISARDMDKKERRRYEKK